MAVTGGMTPVYLPGSRVSMKISAAVTAGQLVEVTGNMTVGPAAAASRKVVGVALQTGSAANDIIAVQIAGYVFRLKASGAVTAGDQVGAGAAGAAITVAGGATADVTRSIVGVALEGAADTALFRAVVGGQI